jgi:hypothetical protein
MWRYWETWQSDAIKLASGQVVRVDAFQPYQAIKGPDGKGQLEIRPAAKVVSSPLPPAGWRGTDFDDSTWMRRQGPMMEGYRSVALMCVRGKFSVPDPTAAPAAGLSLSVGFRGGLVAYLNGREIGRAAMPAGAIDANTPADDYPPEVYVNPDGSPINEKWSQVVSCQAAAKFGNQFKDPQVLSRYQQRCRRLEVKVPASALQRGVNVLALELHRAVANEVMLRAIEHDKWLTAHVVQNPRMAELMRLLGGRWWNRVMLEDVRLTAAGGTGTGAGAGEAAGIVPNVSRPKGVQVWNESVLSRVLPTHFGDPAEPLRPVRILGVRNGTACGQFVVGSSQAIAGLKVAPTDLKDGQGHVLPASAVQVGYARWSPTDRQYDALDPDAPEELPVLAKSPWNRDTAMGPQAGAVQPVWLIVQVPRDLPAGTYRGSAAVSARDNDKLASVPVELRLAGDWAVPEARDLTTYMGIMQSPDSLALQYDVPMWSPAHWKLLDRTFELLAQLGNCEVYITAITRSQLGNEHGMVRWVKQADGTLKPDLAIAEKYLDLAVKHHWNVAMACLYLSDVELGRRNPYLDPPRDPVDVTVVDAATGALSEMPAPKWGTAESQAFWKPVVDGMRAALAKRGMAAAMMFGFGVQNRAPQGAVADLKALAPDVKWAQYTHWGTARLGNKDLWQDVARMAWAFGTPLAVFWDPDTDPPHYNWKTRQKDVIMVAAPRAKAQVAMGQGGELAEFRLTAESTLLGSHAPKGLGGMTGSFHGFGQVGADFWPVLKDPAGRAGPKRLDDRYVSWGSLGMGDTFQAFLGPGRIAPAHSCRSQMMRLSLQEAEARVFVQNALLDEAVKAKLPGELAEECKRICDERTRTLRYCSVFFDDNGREFGRVFNSQQWDDSTERLYQAAGKVAKALAP